MKFIREFDDVQFLELPCGTSVIFDKVEKLDGLTMIYLNNSLIATLEYNKNLVELKRFKNSWELED